MPPAKVQVDNKPSALLTPEENQQITRMLGVRCQTLSTSVVQLYTTKAPNHSQWIKKDTGVLCFVKDNVKKNYFFRIFCFKRKDMIWEHEMYNNMDYLATMPYLHTFEGEEYMIAFNFADVNEAREVKNVVDSKLMAKRRKEEKRSKNTISLEEPRMKVPNRGDTIQIRTKYTDPAAKKAKRKRNITKADISNPSAFRHISHVGWDPNRGFDVNSEDAQLTDFFKKAGVSETELRDTETRKFIYDFIAANGGREAVLTEQKQQQTTRRPPPAVPSPVAGPPVPPRGATRASHSRVAPPPPPTNSAPARPPPATQRTTPQVNAVDTKVSVKLVRLVPAYNISDLEEHIERSLGFDSWSSPEHVNNTDGTDSKTMNTLHNEYEAQHGSDGNETAYDTSAYGAYESSGPRCAYGAHDTFDTLSSSTAYQDYGTNDLCGGFKVFDEHGVHTAYELYDIHDQSHSTYNQHEALDTYVSHGIRETVINESPDITESQNSNEYHDMHDFHNPLHDTNKPDETYGAEDVFNQCSSYLSSYDCGQHNQHMRNNTQDKFVSCETVQDKTFIDLLGSIEEQEVYEDNYDTQEVIGNDTEVQLDDIHLHDARLHNEQFDEEILPSSSVEELELRDDDQLSMSNTRIDDPQESIKETPVNNHSLPPPPAGNAPPPPPPPPLPPLDIPVSPPPPPSMESSMNNSSNHTPPPAPDMRTALMESIRGGKALKPVEEKKPVVVEDPRGDLLSEIRKGFQLKPCNEREVKPVSPNIDTASDLAGALARALAERNRFIHSEDDSTSDTESENDDEWDA